MGSTYIIAHLKVNYGKRITNNPRPCSMLCGTANVIGTQKVGPRVYIRASSSHSTVRTWSLSTIHRRVSVIVINEFTRSWLVVSDKGFLVSCLEGVWNWKGLFENITSSEIYLLAPVRISCLIVCEAPPNTGYTLLFLRNACFTSWSIDLISLSYDRATTARTRFNR